MGSAYAADLAVELLGCSPGSNYTMSTVAETNLIQKMEPLSRGRTDLRKRKPKQIAIINENCTGCAGSPACVAYCPVEACMFWVPDEEYSPFGRIEVDKSTCIGCAKCTSKGPDGTFLDGCPWDAIEMVAIGEWEQSHGVVLPAEPDRPATEWDYVRRDYV
ncbi:MAG: 4Fe-4S dicluster domain-containing protein [Bryobacterales bacterium]|nr:4Fe-4S dicluster domain-containing protein [Bryobacterales bacterium]MEB2360747.1 4Fe-4S dicluster domain-containing protein [Bryobacterales bacterium]